MASVCSPSGIKLCSLFTLHVRIDVIAALNSEVSSNVPFRLDDVEKSVKPAARAIRGSVLIGGFHSNRDENYL